MSIQKNQRALVVISQLTRGVRSDQKWLYRFIESSGRSVGESILKDALAIAEPPITRWPADEAAREYARISKLSWANKVNSDKVLRGDGNITIAFAG